MRMHLFSKTFARVKTLGADAEPLPQRSDLHIARKLWHMLTGMCLVACLLAGVPQSTALFVMGSIFALSASTEWMRLRNPMFNDICVKFMAPFMRSSEVHSVSGMPYYAASAFLAIAIFPRPIAILSLLYLVFGDPIASFVGILSKERSIKILPGKSFQGTAASFTACALATWFYLRFTGMSGVELTRFTLLGGFAGALAEVLPFDIDDNFTIPMVSGFILWLGFIAIQFA